MTTITRRIAATAALLAAPALIALGAAGVSQAEVTSPSVPTHHAAFPQQDNTPQPGTPIHHHKQHRG